ncbi:MAG: RNA polymerase sigma factor (sigma-70 family) [Planctomycetota bacterium]|jgi:RNA polymerase sigma factor (sigma-70 family)
MAQSTDGNNRDSDRVWVREALNQYERPLILYAFQILGDLERAQDVVQDSFLRLCLQDREEIQPIVRAWLFTVCRNRALDVIRKESRMTYMAEEMTHPQGSTTDIDPAQLAERRDHLSHILASVAVLPDRQQEILRLKFQQGLSYREIGKVMEVSISNVGVLIHTALRTLRTKLAASHHDVRRAQGE